MIVRFMVSEEAETREEWRKPGDGVPFCDRWEHDGKVVSGPEMVIIPPGEFMMGSPPDEPKRFNMFKDFAGPQHRVRIAQAFAVGRYAVTFEEWDFAQSDADWQTITGLMPRHPSDYGWGRAKRPVIDVSWEDAKAYVAWLRVRTGRSYRLLSEAEWEYGCRAGTTTTFWWGSSITPAQAAYYDKEDDRDEGEILGTVPVDQFEPNPFGLYQMHGNVCEWVEDKWHETYEGAPADGSAWIVGDNRDNHNRVNRVQRGGCWSFYPVSLRAADRRKGHPTYCSKYGGFRLARTLDL